MNLLFVGGDRSPTTGFAARRVVTIGRRAIVERRKSVLWIDFGRLFNRGHAA
jgi:hypothetical protein